MSSVTIDALTADDIQTHVLQDLCELVRDGVAGGASVGWVIVPSASEAAHYWRGIADQVHSAAVVVLVARASTHVLGTVQLHLSARPNGAHRAEVARLLVHSRAAPGDRGGTHARDRRGRWNPPRSCIRSSRRLITPCRAGEMQLGGAEGRVRRLPGALMSPRHVVCSAGMRH
jgi:hypothetical protein